MTDPSLGPIRRRRLGPLRVHRLGPMELRLLTGFLVVSLTALGVLTLGSVVPHLVAQSGHREAVDTSWLVLAVLVASLTAVAASLLATRRLAAPVQELLALTQAFAAGDRSVHLTDLGRPELANLVDALNAAAVEIERSEQDRQRHTADIAHELRTPLTILQARLEELRDGLVEPTPDTFSTLHDQATRLGRVVSDLAELAAVESIELQLTPADVDLGDVAEVAVEARARAMTDAGLTCRVEARPGVVVLADIDRLHQVVGNLLANSTAYCHPGDAVVVRVYTDGRLGVLEVVDTGPGLTDDERHRAFDRSWRGRQARATPGSGLGLPIVRALVLAQGGRVEMSSVVGTGTTVRVALRMAG